jgi:hypothetical protein
MKIAAIMVLLSAFALGQDGGGIYTLRGITDHGIAMPATCIHGPLRIAWPNGPWVEIGDGGAGLCVYLRGHVGFAVFGGGIYAYNEFGEFVPIFTARSEIREFNYGVH